MASGLGARLPSGELVNILLIADEIIIISNSSAALLSRKGILGGWSRDFRMKISAPKSNIISLDSDLICVISDLIYGESSPLDLVSEYKYLGVVQHLTPKKTSSRKGSTMGERATKFKDVILH